MAQAQLTQAQKDEVAKVVSKAKKTSSKAKKQPLREQIKKCILEAAKKHVDGNIVHQAPDESTERLLCWATGISFDKNAKYQIPLKPVSGVTSSLSKEEYTRKLPLFGQFVSPVAALLFLTRNPQIPEVEKLKQYVIDYYRLDADFVYKQVITALGLLSQHVDDSLTEQFHDIVAPDRANLYNINGHVSKKRPRESSKDHSSKRQRTESSSSSSVASVAKSIEDALVAAQ